MESSKCVHFLRQTTGTGSQMSPTEKLEFYCTFQLKLKRRH